MKVLCPKQSLLMAWILELQEATRTVLNAAACV